MSTLSPLVPAPVRPMKPYYDQDGITIYHGDCRDLLPELTADVVLTDPPYGNNTPYESYEDSPEALVTLAGESFPLMRQTAPLVAITPGVGNIHKWPAPTWTLCWYVPTGGGSGPWGFTTWQPILVYGKDPYLSHGLGRRPDSGTGKMDQKSELLDIRHPVPKPLPWARWLVQRLTVEPSTFVDPFMGGGSFLRAAKDLGHKAIGIEIEEKYCEIAVQRLAQGVLELEA